MTVAIKICGITNVEDAVAAARFGADFVGLNFYPGSRRCITEGQARHILEVLPPNVKPVALFVNQPWELVRDVAGRLGIALVQIHGDGLQPCLDAKLRWIPAFPGRFPQLQSEIDTLLGQCPSDLLPAAILIDAHVPGAYGGTGQAAPWRLIQGLDLDLPLVLAGGLTPDNVAQAIGIVRPWAVDVASGVESTPGIKDHGKMRGFIENARAAGG